jgi:hypothetical protein
MCLKLIDSVQQLFNIFSLGDEPNFMITKLRKTEKYHKELNNIVAETALRRLLKDL